MYVGEESGKSCCGVMVTQTVSIRWFIVMIAFVGICCAVVGTVLGAMRSSGREHLTVSLLMIGKLDQISQQLEEICWIMESWKFFSKATFTCVCGCVMTSEPVERVDKFQTAFMLYIFPPTGWFAFISVVGFIFLFVAFGKKPWRRFLCFLPLVANYREMLSGLSIASLDIPPFPFYYSSFEMPSDVKRENHWGKSSFDTSWQGLFEFVIFPTGTRVCVCMRKLHPLTGSLILLI